MKEYIKPKPDMTPEELENTWFFNFMSRVIHKQFPFIKGLKAREEGANRGKSLIFVDAIVNPWEMAEYYKEDGLRTAVFTTPDRIIPDHTSPLSSMFDIIDSHGDKHSAFNFVYRGVEGSIEELMIDLHKSESIPDELKFHGRPHIMNFYQTTK